MEWDVIKRRDVSFADLEAWQEELFRKVQKNRDLGFFLISEPQPTYTHGRHADPKGLLNPGGFAIQSVSRGGQWTYHGPGQVLVYPIVSLETLGLHRKAIRVFLETFRQSAFYRLQSWGVPVTKQEAPFGLYAEGKKLASFGIAIEDGICRHGMAVYLTDQTSAFQGIHPCGVPGQPSSCLHDFRPDLEWSEAAQGLLESIKNGFKLS